MTNPTVAIALATWVLVGVTLGAVIWQVNRQTYIASGRAVLDFHDRFDAPRMRRARARLSRILLAREAVEEPDVEVLIIFETLGLLTHKKILKKDMVWSEFCWETVRYYRALTRNDDWIASLRRTFKDKTLYGEFEWLYGEMLDIDSQRREMSRSEVQPTDAEIDEYLHTESGLDVHD